MNMSQLEENRAVNKPNSKSTVAASLAALGRDRGFELLPATPAVSVRRRSSGYLGLSGPLATVPARSVGGTHRFGFLQVLSGHAVQLQARPDQHFSFMVFGNCRACIHLLPTSNRESGGRFAGR